jgi:uncharacterized membrane protein
VRLHLVVWQKEEGVQVGSSYCQVDFKVHFDSLLPHSFATARTCAGTFTFLACISMLSTNGFRQQVNDWVKRSMSAASQGLRLESIQT